jgi:hypothetical protein
MGIDTACARARSEQNRVAQVAAVVAMSLQEGGSA